MSSGTWTIPTAHISEAAFQSRIVELCGWLRLYVFHSTDPRRDTASGWPDLVILNLETGAAIYAELKREGGKLTTAQTEVLTALTLGGNEVACWYPHDWDHIEARLRDLAAKGGGR